MGAKCLKQHKTLYIVGWSCTGTGNFLINDHAALPGLQSRGVRFLTGKSALTIHSQLLDYQGVIIFKMRSRATIELQSLHYSENLVFFYLLLDQ